MPRDSAHAGAAAAPFLRCGDLPAGFTRLRCPDCHHEYLLAFSCKQRGLCSSCHQRRVLEEAPFIAEQVCADVPHRHLVLTIPRLLRGRFLGRPGALGELALAARDALTVWLRECSGNGEGRPGIVAVVQTFGDFLLWHPHVHVIATAGVFSADGSFHLVPTGGWSELRELWRHAVLRRLRRAGLVVEWQAQHLLSWRHSGFTLDAGPAPLAATDRAGRRRLAEYLLRAPFSLGKLTYNPAAGLLLYRSERHWRTKRSFEVFRAHDFIAALLSHLPAKGVPSIRYYGWYSNRSRGKRRRAAADATTEAKSATPRTERRRRRWRHLVQAVWGADPLRCPRCPGVLRPTGTVERPAAIRAALEPLGLYAPQTGPPGRGPPLEHGPPLVDAGSGQPLPAGRGHREIRLPHRPKADPLYHRQWMLTGTEETAASYEADESETDEQRFDAIGFALPPWGPARNLPAQGELFRDDVVQSDAPEDEPLFLVESADDPGADDGWQSDAPDERGQ